MSDQDAAAAAATAAPETVASSLEENWEAEYETLKDEFLKEREYENPELAMGMRLRRHVIDTDSPGFKHLKKRIKKLRNDHKAIYSLLKQLKHYMVMNPTVVPACMRDPKAKPTGDVHEVIDLSQEDDEPEVIDIDKYIIEVLLVDVIKPDPDKVVPAVAQAALKRDPDEQSENSEEGGKPSAKKIKSEPHNVEVQKNDSEAAGDSKQRVLVRFEFSSWPTYLFKDADNLIGTMTIPMDQDSKTGLYTIPPDETTGSVEVDVEESDYSSWEEYNQEEEFSLTFNKKHGYTSLIADLYLDYAGYKDKTFDARVRAGNSAFAIEDPALVDAVFQNSVRFECHSVDVDKWEKDQGGMLNFCATAVAPRDNDSLAYDDDDGRGREATYKLKLYTVLSAHPAEEEEFEPYEYEEGDEPDWAKLVELIAARYPEKGGDWPQRAVDQYKLFLQLKLQKGFTKISPSKAIDDIWHAHLSFVERYQHDTLCLTKGESIIEHLPVYIEDSHLSYSKAHQEHTRQMKQRGVKVDEEFWPSPVKPRPHHVHHGDSDDHLPSENDRVASCGPCG